jgi:acetoin utilization protein AcuB
MTLDPVTVEPGTPVSQVARLMGLRHVRRVPVTAPGSHGRRLVGIVSSHDVWRACPASQHPLSASDWPAGEDPGVGVIMTVDVHTTTPDTPIEEAVRVLRRQKIGALPVLRDGRLVGILTESDLLDVLLEVTGAGEPGLRASFELDDGDDDDDVVRALLATCDRHGMRLASMLTFRHPDRETGEQRRLGAARLVGRERPEVVDEIWATCRRVRRIVRSDPRLAGRAGDPAATGAASPREKKLRLESTNR